jgi:hypothetical protein
MVVLEEEHPSGSPSQRTVTPPVPLESPTEKLVGSSTKSGEEATVTGESTGGLPTVNRRPGDVSAVPFVADTVTLTQNVPVSVATQLMEEAFAEGQPGNPDHAYRAPNPCPAAVSASVTELPRSKSIRLALGVVATNGGINSTVLEFPVPSPPIVQTVPDEGS